MGSSKYRPPGRGWVVLVGAGSGLLTLLAGGTGAAHQPAADAKGGYATAVQPLIRKYCLACHSTRVKKGGLDLERLASPDRAGTDLTPWQQVIEQLEAGEMPPKKKPQPTAQERQR